MVPAMPKLKHLPLGKQVLVLFGSLCAILGLIGAFLFLSLRFIQHTSHKQLAYVLNEAELISAAAQNVGLMQAVIFRHIMASDPAEIQAHDQTILELERTN